MMYCYISVAVCWILFNANFVSAYNYGDEFYNISLSFSQNYHSIKQIHIIRVPKASSSSLSAVARRMAGCFPPGPCCKYPGDPKGSCPSTELFSCQLQHKVIGCTHHHPNFPTLLSRTVPSISFMREPLNRSISAFFYPGIHHNSNCKKGQDACFVEYTSSYQWKNIVTKMLNGFFSYEPVETCKETKTCKISLEIASGSLRRLDFMGIAEMWELSMLVLYAKFPQFKPLLSDFYLNKASTSSGTRSNEDKDYNVFKITAHEKYKNQLHQQNELDIILFQRVYEKFCTDLHITKLWEFPVVRAYWKEKALYRTVFCP